MPRRVWPAAAPAAAGSAGVYAALLSQQRFEHDRAGVDPRWARRHNDDEGRWCRQFETSIAPCGHVPPHEVRCCNAGLHEDLEAGRPVVLMARELGRFVEVLPPGSSDDPRWFEVSADDPIGEVAEPEWSRPQPQRFRPERGLGVDAPARRPRRSVRRVTVSPLSTASSARAQFRSSMNNRYRWCLPAGPHSCRPPDSSQNRCSPRWPRLRQP